MAYGFNEDKSKIEIEPLPISLGGTGASTAEDARMNLRAVSRREITVSDSGSPDFLLSTLVAQNAVLTQGLNYIDINRSKVGYYLMSLGGIRLSNNNPSLSVQGAHFGNNARVTVVIYNSSSSNITTDITVDVVEISSGFKNS